MDGVCVKRERQRGRCCTAVPLVHVPTFSRVYSGCREGCALSLLPSPVCVCLYLHVYIDTVGRNTGSFFDPLCLSLAQHFSITSASHCVSTLYSLLFP